MIPPVPSRPAIRASASLAVFLAGLLLILALHGYGRPFAVKGVYFQRHSSEDMMQTLSLLDLRGDPGGSLLVLHIQPPLLDGLRAALARLGPGLAPQELLVLVDRSLYLLWALVYAGTGTLVFVWLRRIAGRPWPSSSRADSKSSTCGRSRAR